MPNLEQSILQTLIYFDIFEYPLTLLEIHKWLWQYPEPNLFTIKQALFNLTNQKKIVEQTGFYCLAGRDQNIQTRLRRYRLAEEKIQLARRYITLLSLTPFVRGIFICNNLAFHNSRPTSDIDLLVITVPGHIWTARALMTGLVKLLHLRPTAKQTKNKLCLSFFLTTNTLNLEKIKIHPQRDIYLTYWLDQLLPLYQTADCYPQFYRANHWIKQYLPQSYGYKLASAPRVVKTPFRRRIKAWLEYLPGEQLFKKLQLKILPQNLKQLMNQDTRVIINDQMLKLHAVDRREEYQQLWLQKISQL